MRPRASRLCAMMISFCALAAACGPQATPDQRMADEYWEKIRPAPDPALWDIFRASNERAAVDNGDPENARGVELKLRYIEAGAAHAEASGDLKVATLVLDVIQWVRTRDRVAAYEMQLRGFTKRFEAAEARITPLLR